MLGLGMGIIIIEPPRGDAGEELRRALDALKNAGIKARRRSRSLQSTTLLQVEDPAEDEALRVLQSANIRAMLRPS